MNEQLKKIMAEVLEIDAAAIDTSTSVATEPKWDSLRHMTLIFAIEDALGVRFDDDDLPRLTSVSAIEQALAAR